MAAQLETVRVRRRLARARCRLRPSTGPAGGHQTRRSPGGRSRDHNSSISRPVRRVAGEVESGDHWAWSKEGTIEYVAAVVATPAHVRCRRGRDRARVPSIVGVAEQRSRLSEHANVWHVEVGRCIAAQDDGRSPRRRREGVGQYPAGPTDVIESKLEALVHRSCAGPRKIGQRSPHRMPDLHDGLEEIRHRWVTLLVHQVRGAGVWRGVWTRSRVTDRAAPRSPALHAPPNRRARRGRRRASKPCRTAVGYG